MRSEEGVWCVVGRRRESGGMPLDASDGRDGQPRPGVRFAELEAFSEEVARRSLRLLIPDDETDGSR